MGKGARLKRVRREAKQREMDAAAQKTLRWFIAQGHLNHVRERILAAGARIDSCIFSTHVLKLLADRVELRMDPLVVEAHCFNRIAADEWARTNGFEGYANDDWRVLEDRGGRMLTLGYREGPTEPNKWPGHLIGIVRPKHASAPAYAIDLSADQANRPHKGINIDKPICFPVERPDFLTGSVPACLRGSDGGLIMYCAFPDDESFKTTPDWVKTPEIGFDR